MISLSENEIIKWDLNIGIAMQIGKFPNSVIGVESVSYLDEKHLILIYNDTNFL